MNKNRILRDVKSIGETLSKLRLFCLYWTLGCHPLRSSPRGTKMGFLTSLRIGIRSLSTRRNNNTRDYRPRLSSATEISSG